MRRRALRQASQAPWREPGREGVVEDEVGAPVDRSAVRSGTVPEAVVVEEEVEAEAMEFEEAILEGSSMSSTSCGPVGMDVRKCRSRLGSRCTVAGQTTSSARSMTWTRGWWGRARSWRWLWLVRDMALNFQ